MNSKYKADAEEIRALCIKIGIVVAQCDANVQTIKSGLAAASAEKQAGALPLLAAALLNEAEKAAKNAKEQLEGCIHNAVNAERKSLTASEDEAKQERPSHKDNAKMCLALARFEWEYTRAAFNTAHKLFEIPVIPFVQRGNAIMDALGEPQPDAIYEIQEDGTWAKL